MRSALLELVIPSVCPGCDLPRREGEPLLCDLCRRSLIPLYEVARIPTALAYEGTGARLTQRFKFDGRKDALAVLLEPLLERAKDFDVDGVVPVSRHLVRVRELGFDPVYELARAFAARAQLPFWPRVLHRTRPTPPQTGLKPPERRANVRGSFSARRRALRGRKVLLLDDVATTGSTLREAAQALRRQAGARRVVRLALAGTPNRAL